MQDWKRLTTLITSSWIFEPTNRCSILYHNSTSQGKPSGNSVHGRHLPRSLFIYLFFSCFQLLILSNYFKILKLEKSVYIWGGEKDKGYEYILFCNIRFCIVSDIRNYRRNIQGTLLIQKNEENSIKYLTFSYDTLLMIIYIIRNKGILYCGSSWMHAKHLQKIRTESLWIISELAWTRHCIFTSWKNSRIQNKQLNFKRKKWEVRNRSL